MSHEIADDTLNSLKITLVIHSHRENSREAASSPADSCVVGSFLFGPWVLMNIFTFGTFSVCSVDKRMRLLAA